MLRIRLHNLIYRYNGFRAHLRIFAACEISNDSAGISNDSAGIFNDSAGISNDSAEISNDSAGISNDSAGISNDSAGISNVGAGISNDSARIPQYNCFSYVCFSRTKDTLHNVLGTFSTAN